MDKSLAIKRFLIGAASLLLVVTCKAQESSDKYVGTGSCSSSNCHGSVHPLKGSNVLQNEYYTWLKHDRHSQAYNVLLKSDAKRMASLLGMGEPSKEPLCLKCHATYVPDKARQGEKFDIEDGVSCESCHGAAERWLESHTAATASHDQNRAQGLADTVSLDKRAKLCISCHYGDADKRVTHDLYGAGHPRLSFELDTFGVLEPKHWVVDDDYLKRKAAYVPISAWFVGQETQAEAVVTTLLSPGLTKNGTFPELSIFDCFSCHHSLAEQQWKQRTYGGKPGRLHINIAPLLMLSRALVAVDEPLAKDLSQLVTVLHTSYQEDGARETLLNLQTILENRVRPVVTGLQGSASLCRSVMKQLSEFGAETDSPKFEVAEQVGMGIQAAMATSPELSKRYKSSLDNLFGTLTNSRAFNPKKFTDAAAKLSKSLS